MQKTIYIVGTMDTKGDETLFVAEQIRKTGASVVTVDVSAGSSEPNTASQSANISRATVLGFHPDAAVGQSMTSGSSDNTDRGRAVTEISRAFEAFLLQEQRTGKIGGVIGIGGSGGTAIITTGMRAMPIGLPKVMVSTVASANVAPYVGANDITMMYSVVDVAGLNAVSRRVLSNAAHAIAGMVFNFQEDKSAKPTLGMTMFGVTTPCVERVRATLEAKGYDCLVFHATGTGGQAMEKMVESGLIQGVLDITTTEVADEVVGGVFPGGPKRFDAIIEKKIPYVMSLGALDMVNFGAKETVPAQFQNRRLHVHNANVTLMRTTPEENKQFAAWIAKKVNRSTAPLTILVPEKGVSAIDAPEKPFYDPDANVALFTELERLIEQTPTRKIIRLAHNINDPEFADALVNEFLKLVAKTN
jgi:uncharacterized protein (UPF0261 family)